VKDGVIVMNGTWMCHKHHTTFAGRILRRNYRELEGLLIDGWNNGVDLNDMRREAYEHYDAHLITLAGFRQLENLLIRWMRVENRLLHAATIQQGPPRTLAEIAVNKQSVHTAAVSEQTNRAMEVLLSQAVPDTLDVVKLLRFEDNTVKTDVVKWYTMTTCRGFDDYLYHKALDGLWVLIQSHKEKDELVKRLLEEMKESVGMCCEGHISRLCNVMVGFDDRFSPPIPVGELLQQRISAIAAKEVSAEEKVVLAWPVFEELKIPMDERDAWIEAF
jgi:hypothetical protein